LGFKLFDLSQTMRDAATSYPGNRTGLRVERLPTKNADSQLSCFTLFDPHCGTHLDAPRHFVAAGLDVAELPLAVLPATVVAAEGPRIGPEAFARLGPLRGRAVLVHTGWEIHAGSPAYYRDYPCPTPEAAAWLVGQGIALLGLDTPSADPIAQPLVFPVHETVLGAGVPIVEGLVGLDRLLGLKDPLFFLGLPLKLEGVEGSPIRAAAMVVED